VTDFQTFATITALQIENNNLRMQLAEALKERIKDLTAIKEAYDALNRRSDK
jgi:regulator of replication initiation timing